MRVVVVGVCSAGITLSGGYVLLLQSSEMAIESSASALQTCPACGASIDTTGAEPLARVECPNCGEKVLADRKFDHFVILETVGIGGMGTVYKARDTLLDRFVALKLLRKDLEGGLDSTAELRQEARAAAAVNHPNIVQVFSSGTDHGQFYLVMELVERGSLDDFIEQQTRLPEEQVLEAGIQTAKGLRAAYGKGLVHRDVKPANILFAEENLAKIGDFGLAGIAAEARGEVWGTPYYVSPERLNNQPEDFRSDIYSLGATLFHALAGRAPIEGDTNSASDLLALKQQPLLLSVVAPEVSPDTARVLQRMIAPNPAQRFSSYDEVVAELEAAYKKLTGREETQAREAFLAVQNAGPKGFAKEDVDLANFFLATSKTLLAPAAIQSSSVSVKGPGSPEVFALFPFALKDIEQLDIQNATQLLDQFLKAQPSGKFAWIAELKPIAQKYLNDCRFYLAWKNNASPARTISPPDRRQLKTRSAISDAIFGKEKSAAP